MSEKWVDVQGFSGRLCVLVTSRDFWCQSQRSWEGGVIENGDSRLTAAIDRGDAGGAPGGVGGGKKEATQHPQHTHTHRLLAAHELYPLVTLKLLKMNSGELLFTSLCLQLQMLPLSVLPQSRCREGKVVRRSLHRRPVVKSSLKHSFNLCFRCLGPSHFKYLLLYCIYMCMRF